MSRSILATVLGGYVALAIAGCHHDDPAPDPGPTCFKVVENMRHVMHQGMEGHEAIKDKTRKVMVDQCEKQGLSAEVKTCLVKAQTLADIANCRHGIPMTQAQIDARGMIGSDRVGTRGGSGNGDGNGNGSGSSGGSH